MNRPFSPVQIWNSFLKIIPYSGITFGVVLGTMLFGSLLAVLLFIQRKSNNRFVRSVYYDEDSKSVKLETTGGYICNIDSASLADGTSQNETLEMYLSEEFNDFYDQKVNTFFPDAKSIEVVDGKYVVTGIYGNTYTVEKGQLGSKELLGNLFNNKR